jgi:hypothetical protein
VNFRGTDTFGWNWVSDPFFASGEASGFYVPIETDPRVSGTIFVGLEHVFRTKDSGGSQAYLEQHCNEYTGDFAATCGDWERLGSARLTSPVFGDRDGAYVAALARSPADATTLWAATATGRVFVSTNADAPAAAVLFTRIDDDSPLAPERFISGIVVDPRDPHHAWIAYSGYDAYTPWAPGHVFEVRYRPSTGASTWTDVSFDLGDQPITGIAYDDTEASLYASTDFGVLELPLGASSWGAASPGLPPVAVYGLTISSPGRVLYAATHGRGIWSLRLP